MPIRLRITLLFTITVFFILGIICLAVYYFSATARMNSIKTRLTNRAITTARLLRQSEVFDRNMVHHIDSLTTISLKNKSVQTYNAENELIYAYRDSGAPVIQIDTITLEKARDKKIVYFSENKLEAIAYCNADRQDGIVTICAAEDEDGQSVLRGLKQILGWTFVVGTILSFVGGLYFSKKILQPIKKITNEVNDISAYNLERRIPTTETRDEWYQLSTTLNQLLDRLKDSFELQRRFISNASHELSTPLTLISSQLEISLQRTRTQQEYEVAMKSILKDVQYMNNLVQTLLKFATASGDAGGLNIDLVRIDEILMRLPAEIQKQDSKYSVTLHFDQLPDKEENLLIFGNEELLFTAVRNIVTNACKYSPDHHADITLHLDEKQFRIAVTDKGVGIEEKEISNIFQPFYRIEEVRTIKGFGLGLSLANRIIKLHKGNISVSSVPLKGTTFTIELPVGKVL